MSFARTLARKIPPLRKLYTAYLDRSQLCAAIDGLQQDRTQLTAELAEARQAVLNWRSPFAHYTGSFDPCALVNRHAARDLKPAPGYLTNFLGVLIDPKFFPAILDGRAGEVETPPPVCNWHACVAEWGAALRAVELAGPKFTMIELGCGWGCWMNNTGVAAKRMGKTVQLSGIEGDEAHIQFAREALAANGFLRQEYRLHHGVAAGQNGIALFPRQEQGGASWGLEPVFGASPAQRDEAVRSGKFDALPMLSLAGIAADDERIDLLHIDIQGGETALIESCLPVLRDKVAYLLIGTHSRQIDGALFDMLLRDGWLLEIERPALITIEQGQPAIHSDGVQGWRNPRLFASQAA